MVLEPKMPMQSSEQPNRTRAETHFGLRNIPLFWISTSSLVKMLVSKILTGSLTKSSWISAMASKISESTQKNSKLSVIILTKREKVVTASNFLRSKTNLESTAQDWTETPS